MESVHGYLWEKKVPVEATFSGVWGQGDQGTVALCLLHSWCVLPVPARSGCLCLLLALSVAARVPWGRDLAIPSHLGCVSWDNRAFLSLCLQPNAEGGICVGISSAVGGCAGCGLMVCSDLQCIGDCEAHPWIPEVRPVVIPSDQFPFVSCSQPGKSPVPCTTRNDANEQCRHTVVYINFYLGVCVKNIWSRFNHT